MTEVDVVGADGEKWTGSIAIGTPAIDESNISEETPAADVKESTPIMHNMDGKIHNWIWQRIYKFVVDHGVLDPPPGFFDHIM